jgi:hypothetical protein
VRVSDQAPEAMEGEVVVESTATELDAVPAPVTTLAVAPQVDAGELVARLDAIKQAQEQAMTKDVDYGVIPGTDKPTLYKPGAEKLSVLFQLDVQLVNEKSWGPGEHLTVISHATVFHAPTGSRLGYGEGVCTTRERKYAYRKQERVCPNCNTAAVIKGKEEYGGGWLCWAKRGGCNSKWKDGAEVIESQEAGEVDNPDLPDLWNCVTPDTRILTRDLRWVPAGEITTGDILIGVNEELPDKHGRRYEDATATVGDRFTDELYEVKIEDGRVVRCNGEHCWLVKSVGSGVEWVTTEDIHESLNGERRGRPRGWHVMEIGAPWEPEGSLEAGYLAGLLDADGSLDVGRTVGPDGELLYHGVGVSFTQQEGGVLDRFIAGLTARGFAYGEYSHGNPNVRVPVTTLGVRGGFFEQLRFLGTIRPPRLLERWRDLVDLSRRRFEGRSVRVVSVEKVGPGELVRLGTSSRTYIAEGLVCHNTAVKMAEKRARVDAVLAVTGASALFTQDVEDMASSGEAGGQQQPARVPPSDKQLDLIERLLKQRGGDPAELATARAYMVENLTGGKQGTASQTIELLKDDEQAGAIALRLVTKAAEWQARESDVPADTDGLPMGQAA